MTQWPRAALDPGRTGAAVGDSIRHRAVPGGPASPRHDLEARARFFATTLVGWPSVTGTPDEAAFAHRLTGLLRADPYFARHPDNVVPVPVPDDPLGRSSVLALVRGSGRATVLLCGHFDVVPVDDYGDLAPLSTQPEALRSALIARLRRTGSHPRALADLDSGAFVPGRGMLDMKGGVAAGLAVLEAFAADPNAGNLLLVATPDEEDRSEGIRSVMAVLPDMLREWGLDARLAVNLDAACDDGDGSAGRIVAGGCIGKLLLSAYVVGRETHACYPFAGVNAAALAAELVTEIEGAPELGEITDGEVAAPPTVLGFRDGKSVYNVTTPGDAWVFWNVLHHRRSAAEVLRIAADLTRRAIGRAALRTRERAAQCGLAAGLAGAWDDVPVTTYADLLERACRHRDGFMDTLAAEAESLAGDAALDLPERSRRLTRTCWAASGQDGPAVVLGFASNPYPAVDWPSGEDGSALAARVDAAWGAAAGRLGVPVEKRRFFPAMIDMSFIGPVDEAGFAAAAANTPVWGTSFRWTLDRPPTLGVPTVNIGPWGRDYHHWLERAHADYAFRVLPELVWAVARSVLDPG